MKTFKVLSFAVLLLLTAYQVGVNAAIPGQPATMQEFNRSKLVKAVYNNGRLLPVVDLPEVEISALHVGSTLLKSTYSNGQNMLVADLPEITISGIALNKGKIKNEIKNGVYYAIINLPIIEVVSDLPVNRLVKVSDYNHVPIINLPEIVINAYPADAIFTTASYKEGLIMPLINLPEIEITSSYSMISFETSTTPSYIFREAAWYSISLERCGIIREHLIVCELRSATQFGQPMLTGDKIDLN